MTGPADRRHSPRASSSTRSSEGLAYPSVRPASAPASRAERRSGTKQAPVPAAPGPRRRTSSDPVADAQAVLDHRLRQLNADPTSNPQAIAQAVSALKKVRADAPEIALMSKAELSEGVSAGLDAATAWSNARS